MFVNMAASTNANNITDQLTRDPVLNKGDGKSEKDGIDSDNSTGYGQSKDLDIIISFASYMIIHIIMVYIYINYVNSKNIDNNYCTMKSHNCQLIN